jgi:hypothetical protein
MNSLIWTFLKFVSRGIRMNTNDMTDSYQQIYVIAHIICNHPVHSNSL